MSSSTLPANTILVMNALKTARSGLTRAQIAQQTALSAPTVSNALTGLNAQGLAAKKKTLAPPSNGTGRPAEVWEATMPNGTLLGIALGHRHVVVLAADTSGTPLNRKETGALDVEMKELDVDVDGPAALYTVANMVTTALEKAERTQESVLGIGVGMPAPIDAHFELAAPDYLPKWIGVDVDEKLRALLTGVGSEVAITIENDANLGAIAERSSGVAVGLDDFMYVKLSTGIGLGALLAGEPYRGAHGRAAELGHRRVPPEVESQLVEQSTSYFTPPPCLRCRRVDCLENLASGAAMLRQLDQRTRRRWTLDEVIRGTQDDPLDERDLRDVVIASTIRIGATVAEVAELLDPSMIVLGGSLSRLGPELQQQVTAWLNKSSARPVNIRVEPVEESRIDHCEALGAVQLAYEQLRTITDS